MISACALLCAAFGGLAVQVDRVGMISTAIDIPQVSKVSPGNAIERAIVMRQTGVFILFRAGLAQDGEIETLAVLADGQLLDAVARRRGQVLRRTDSTLPMQLLPAAAARVMQAPLDQPIADAAQRRQFLSLLGWSGASADLTADPAKPASKLWLSSAQPGGGLVYFNSAGRSALSRWGFEYVPGRTFAFFEGKSRIQWSLGG